MFRKIVLVFALVFIATIGYAEEPKVLPITEEKPYCISCRVDELVQEANKLQNLIQQASVRIEQIKGAITELKKIEPKEEEEK